MLLTKLVFGAQIKVIHWTLWREVDNNVVIMKDAKRRVVVEISAKLCLRFKAVIELLTCTPTFHDFVRKSQMHDDIIERSLL
jgi:hypothetical protein